MTATGALEAVDRIVNRGGEADDVLRRVVEELRAQLPHLERVAVDFVEAGDIATGPVAGSTRLEELERFAIDFNGVTVAYLTAPRQVISDADRRALERIAVVIAPYCLVGWDTGGEPWTP